MIYLIGGPPKCGKSTLAQKLSQNLRIPWVSSDTLQVVAREYIKKYAPEQVAKLYPHNANKGRTNDITYSQHSPIQIAQYYITQAKVAYAAIDMFSICEITDQHDYIIEGYHVTPELAARLVKKYGSEHFKIVFLVKSDAQKFVHDIQKSSTQNDWIIKKTHTQETFEKIAEMVTYYSTYIRTQADKYSFPVFTMDTDFTTQLQKIMTFLKQL